MSNDWKLVINLDKLKEKEEEEYLKMLETVAEIEKITNATELILQTRSIYSEAYRPKYIEEMNDIEKIKELSDVIQDRLRNVKLAVSKANLNQSKMVDLTRKKEDTNKNNINIISNVKGGVIPPKKKLAPITLGKSKSALDILKKKTEITEKKEQTVSNTALGETKEKFNKENQENQEKQENEKSEKNETQSQININEQIPENEQEKTQTQIQIPNKTGTEMSVISGLKKNLLPKYPKKILPIIKSKYAVSKRK